MWQRIRLPCCLEKIHFITSNCCPVCKKTHFITFVIGIQSMQDWTTTMRHGVTRKRSIKRLKHTENLFRKNLQLTYWSVILLSISCLEKIHFIYFIGAGGIKLFCYHVWKKNHFETFGGHTVICSLVAVDNKTVIFITFHTEKH